MQPYVPYSEDAEEEDEDDEEEHDDPGNPQEEGETSDDNDSCSESESESDTSDSASTSDNKVSSKISVRRSAVSVHMAKSREGTPHNATEDRGMSANTSSKNWWKPLIAIGFIKGTQKKIRAVREADHQEQHTSEVSETSTNTRRFSKASTATATKTNSSSEFGSEDKNDSSDSEKC